jgi:hypothetical protein
VEIIKKREESEQVRHEYVKNQQQELESRKIEEQIKQMDKQDNVSRIFKQQE